jgi:hypothetical protein
MNINKLKIIQISSNGRINFTHKTCSNSKLFNFLEKDNKNFHLNMKKTTNSQVNKKLSSGYKKKFF